VTVRHEVFLLSDPGTTVARGRQEDLDIGPEASVESRVQLTVKSPQLWDIDSPVLYGVRTTVERDGQNLDEVVTPFGIRTIAFSPSEGFSLNGRHIRLNGVCDHHDLGPIGAAINVSALERQLQILREMGVNAIRTSHNPPAPELLDLCDHLGFLVMDEAFDCWGVAKTPNDYSRDFADWHERDVRALVLRDRNHPCVILWSSGNEIPEQSRPNGLKTAEALRELFHKEDPTRPVAGALNHVDAVGDGFYRGFDVIGRNYKPMLYAKEHALAPDYAIFGSETASTLSSRGEYFFPLSEDPKAGAVNFQVTSYDLNYPRWATTPDAEFAGQDRNPFVMGEFIWTGFDYLGEPTPYNKDATNLLNFQNEADRTRLLGEMNKLGVNLPSRSSYFGVVDLCGFKKDRFYLYQSRWRPELAMAHILPHWTWPERVGQLTPVQVYTSGDEAELFLNGVSLGRKTKAPFEYRLRWDNVRYEPGEIKVVAYRDGKMWATDSQRTTGKAARIEGAADRAVLHADGKDLAFITIRIEDREGRIVPRAANRVRFRLTGPGEIVAVDNGDATRLESFQAHDCAAFNGLCLVIVRGQRGRLGEIVLHAGADSLQSARVPIASVGDSPGPSARSR
jgi:beta-galactosidase